MSTLKPPMYPIAQAPVNVALCEVTPVGYGSGRVLGSSSCAQHTLQMTNKHSESGEWKRPRTHGFRGREPLALRKVHTAPRAARQMYTSREMYNWAKCFLKNQIILFSLEHINYLMFHGTL